MQKKIIVLAIAAALSAPAMALADVTTYGQFNVSIDMVDEGQTTNSAKANQMNGAANGSRIGFKGNEALDGGMNIDWQLEAEVGVDDGSSNFFGRESNIGIGSSSIGTVRLGLQASPYKASTRQLDVFNDTAADNRALLSRGHDNSATNAVSYASPSLGGLTLVVATGFTNETPQPSGYNKSSAVGLAAMYTAGPFYAALAVDNGKAAVTGDKDSATMLGGSYSMDALTISAEVEQLKLTAGTTEIKNTNMYLGAKFNISSSDAVKLAYTSVGEDKAGGAGADNGVTQVAIGYDHSLSKSTSVYALYAATSADDTTNDNEPTVLSFGLKHAF